MDRHLSPELAACSLASRRACAPPLALLCAPRAAQLNAWATWLTCQWLMGECEVNDVEIDGGAVGQGHGVLVKR